MMEENQYNTCFNELHTLWKSSRNEFEEVLMDHLTSCNNPYLLVLQCIKRCSGLIKQNNEASAYLVKLHLFKRLKDDQEKFREYVDGNVINGLLEIIPRIKTNSICILFVKAFGLIDIDSQARLRFEQIISEMISLQQYKDACIFVSNLKLYEHFERDELLIKLFLKYNELIAVENFINDSPKHQKEFLTVLDKLVGIQGYYEQLVQKYNIENKSIFNKRKSFRKIAIRLLKKYNIDISHCPNISEKYPSKEIENSNLLADNGSEEVIKNCENSYPEYYSLKISKDDISDMIEENQYNTCFNDLHQLWISNRNEYDKVLLDQLASCNTPYLFALQCMKRWPGLGKLNSQHEVSIFLKTLIYFKKQNDEKFQVDIDENILKSLLELFRKINSIGIQILFVKAFGLTDMDTDTRLRFEPIIWGMIASHQYKNACNLISTLKLHEHFISDELLVPLFLKYNSVEIVESFINDSPKLQKEFLTLLDNFVGNNRYYRRLAQKYNIKDKSILKNNSKSFSKIATILLKKYNMDMSHCPHIQTRLMSGSLHFIYTKFYKERSITRSTFYSLINDAVKDNPKLKILVIRFFCRYQDINAALPFVNLYQLQIEQLPDSIKKEYGKYSPKEIDLFLADNGIEEVIETWDESLPDYYSLKLDKNNVNVVDTSEKFIDCMESACVASLVAVDAEWKTIGGPLEMELLEMGLLQLAYDNQAFLIDFVTLLPILAETQWIRLTNIFTDRNIRKIGFGIDKDIKVLQTVNQTMDQNLVNIKNILDFKDYKNHLITQCPEIFSFDDMNNKGLSGMVCQCFGQPLNKTEQVSNWVARPLSVGQIKYAAQDAQCLLDIYNYLEERCKSLGLPDWKIKQPISKNQTQNKINTMTSRLGKMALKSKISTTAQAGTISKISKASVHEKSASNLSEMQMYTARAVGSSCKRITSQATKTDSWIATGNSQNIKDKVTSCGYCGKGGHGNSYNPGIRRKVCPAFGHRCKNCSKRHHYESVCRSKATPNQLNSHQKTVARI